MKVDTPIIKRACELGILRSIPDFFPEGTKLEKGRLNNRFVSVYSIVRTELERLNARYTDLFPDNKEDLAKYLFIFNQVVIKKGTPMGYMIAFCLEFLKHSSTIYPGKLVESLTDILEYYQRKNPDVDYREPYNCQKARDIWKQLQDFKL